MAAHFVNTARRISVRERKAFMCVFFCVYGRLILVMKWQFFSKPPSLPLVHGSDCSLCSLAHKYQETHSFVQLRCKSNVLPAQMLNSNKSRWQSLINGPLEKRQTNCKLLPSPFFFFGNFTWIVSVGYDGLRCVLQRYLCYYATNRAGLFKIVIWLHKESSFSIIILVIWALKSAQLLVH